MKFINLKSAMMAVLVLVAVGTIGCSKGANNVAPAPPITTNPGVGGSCGSVGGTPITNDAQGIQANLVGGSASNSMQLSLFFASGSYNYNQSAQSVNGSAQMVFPALQSIWTYLTGSQTPVPQTTFCVSSSDVQSGQPTPGTLGGYNGGVSSPCGNSGTPLSITMRGLVTLPQPYGGYNSAGGQIQDVVEVVVGPQGAPAVLCQGRLYGSATVKVSYDQARLYRLQ